MSTSFWLVQLLNAVSFGMLLFLLSSGLSLIFGLMQVLNLAHGSLYLLSGYIAMSAFAHTQSFPLAILAALVAIAVLGAAMERFVLRPLQGDELRQVLATYGFLLIFADAAYYIWGGNPETLPKPRMLEDSVAIGSDFAFPAYRLFVIGAGLVFGAALWWLQERTLLGARIRAGVDDRQMASGIGINVSRLFTTVFVLGAALAAAGGLLGSAFTGLYPGLDLEVLMLALVVVIIGGQGSIAGSFVGGILVGLIDTFAKVFIPQIALVSMFVLMAIVLVTRPTGLFGRR